MNVNTVIYVDGMTERCRQRLPSDVSWRIELSDTEKGGMTVRTILQKRGGRRVTSEAREKALIRGYPDQMAEHHFEQIEAKASTDAER